MDGLDCFTKVEATGPTDSTVATDVRFSEGGHD